MDEIYIVEDDENIRDLVAYALRASGFEASGFETAAAFFHALNAAPKPALVLLDIMLPEQDGLSVLRRIRETPDTASLPVIMMTAKGSEFDKVQGLDLGADDYVTKPFGVTELISRVRAVLRRSYRSTDENSHLTYRDITLSIPKRRVFVGDVEVHLTFKEYELLYYFLCNPDVALSRERLLAQVWGFDFEGETRTVDMHIKTLRQKLGDAGAYIKTVRSVGYKIGD